MHAGASRPADEPVGGRYELLEPVGEGNFSVAYRAWDVVLERAVAVKMLRQQFAADPTFVARFEREARVAASVSHPNVVDVYDFGPYRDTFFIAMQFVPGPTLKQALDERGRFSPTEAVRAASQILDGLAAIHAAGIVHRDIKPQNVLLGRDDMARVTDFGVAHYPLRGGLTTHGTTVGTASYMAPEQARGSALSEATDLYAVGVVLFELLTGRLPFEADNPMAVMLAHLQRPAPTLREVAPDAEVPAGVAAEVARALAKNPAERQPSATDMAAALRAGLVGGASSATATIETVVPPAASDREANGTLVSGAVGGSKASAAGARPARIGAPTSLPLIAPRRRVAAWLAPLALFVLALAGVGGWMATGGGLPGGGGSGGQGGGQATRAAVAAIAAVDGTESPAPSPASTSPTATVRPTPRAIVVPQLSPPTPRPMEVGSGVPTEPATFAATETPSPSPTPSPAPTAEVRPTATAEPTPEPTATPTPEPTEAPSPTATATVAPVPTATPEPPAVPVVVDPSGGVLGDGGAPADEPVLPEPPAAEPPDAVSVDGQSAGGGATGGGGRTVRFSSADWSGGVPTNRDWYGRPAVAIYGAQGASPQATLAFDLATVPRGDMILTLVGLGDETGASFAFEVGVNGTSASGLISGFPNWDPAVHGPQGQSAPWSEMEIAIPGSLLQSGRNEITVVSRQPGTHGSGLPHLLLTDATLAPVGRASTASDGAVVEALAARGGGARGGGEQGNGAPANAEKSDREKRQAANRGSGNSGREKEKNKEKDDDDEDEGDD